MARAEAAAARGTEPRRSAPVDLSKPTADQLWTILVKFSNKHGMKLSLSARGGHPVVCSIITKSSQLHTFEGATITEALTMATHAFEFLL